MKKKQIFAMGMSAILACSSVAFAADVATPANTTTSAETEQTVSTAAVTRLGAMATVKQVNQTEGVVKSVLITTDDEQEIQLNIGEQTLVVDNQTGTVAGLDTLKAGDKIFAYYSAAMTRSLPPQSACELILVNVGEQATASLHEVGTVIPEENARVAILNAAGDMIIRMDDKTAITSLDGKTLTTGDLTAGTRFLAWYDIVLTSYPGQTYAEKVVVLSNAEPRETETQPTETVEYQPTEWTIVAGGKTLDVKATAQGETVVIPVRAVAEALGCTVSYEQKDGKEFVTVENDTRAMTMEIGVDNYVSTTKLEGAVGMTAPAQYGVAPYVTDGTTYAPADMFKALVGFDVTVTDGTVTVTAQK